MSIKRAKRYLGVAAITSAIAAAGAPSGAAIGVPSGWAAATLAGDSAPVAETQAAGAETGFQWDDAAVGAAVAAAIGGLTAALGGARRSRSSRAQHVLS
jgi:hypothetical protein